MANDKGQLTAKLDKIHLGGVAQGIVRAFQQITGDFHPERLVNRTSKKYKTTDTAERER